MSDQQTASRRQADGKNSAIDRSDTVRAHYRTLSGASPTVTRGAHELRLPLAHAARKVSPDYSNPSLWADWNYAVLQDWNNASGAKSESGLLMSADSSPAIANVAGTFTEDFNGQNGKFYAGTAEGSFTYYTNMGVERRRHRAGHHGHARRQLRGGLRDTQ